MRVSVGMQKELMDKVEALEQQLKDCRDWIERNIEHGWNCSYMDDIEKPECDCGLDKLLKGGKDELQNN